MSLLVVGALHWDAVVEASRLPRLGETLRGRRVDYRLGGKGGNQAVAAARAGARVAFAGRVGRDAPGRAMARALAEAGVDARLLQRGRGRSGMSAAIAVDGGEYGAVTVAGENHAFDAEGLRVPDGCRIVLSQNEMAAGLPARLSAAARAAGAQFWMNLAPAASPGAALAAGLADVLIVNRVEAGDLLGRRIAGLGPLGIAEALQGAAPGADCVVTLGGGGVAVKPRGSEPFHRPAMPVEAAQSHGAGDAFCGALAAARLDGRDWGSAVAEAQRAAAAHMAQIR